jgi:abortive infection bacteriophage resistance protein
MEKKLTIEEQVHRLRDFYGVSFSGMSEGEAIDYLENNSYYAKIRSYLNSFLWSEEQEKYVKVDFQALVRLATLDMYLRKTLLSLLLDIEHLYKTLFIKLLTHDEQVDGYDIVEKCAGYIHLERIQSRIKETDYSAHIAMRFEKQQNIWNLVELMSFSDFRSLFAFYSNMKNLRELTFTTSLLSSANILRNACAHNSALLHNLNKEINHYMFTPRQDLHDFLTDRVLVKTKTAQRLVEIPITHDIVASVLLLAIMPKHPLFYWRTKELKEFLSDQCCYMGELFKSQHHLKVMHRDLSEFLDAVEQAREDEAISLWG